MCAALAYGNRCGHDPKMPRSAVFPSQHKPRPNILEKAKKNLYLLFYLKPKEFLIDLNFNKSNRQKRTEKREAINQTLEVLFHYCDLITLKIGIDNDGIFIPLSLKKIAKLAGIELWRARRAIKDLVKAGYLSVTRRFTKTADGKIIGKVSIRQLSARVFTHLGIPYAFLELNRHWKRKSLMKKNVQKSPAPDFFMESIKKITGKNYQNKPKAPTKGYASPAECRSAREIIEARIKEAIANKRLLHPEKTDEELRELLASSPLAP